MEGSHCLDRRTDPPSRLSKSLRVAADRLCCRLKVRRALGKPTTLQASKSQIVILLPYILIQHSYALSAFRYAPEDILEAPGEGEGSRPAYSVPFRRHVAHRAALSPQPPPGAFLGAPTNHAGQGATLLTALIRFRPVRDARHRIGRWMEWAHQSQRFFRRLTPPRAPVWWAVQSARSIRGADRTACDAE